MRPFAKLLPTRVIIIIIIIIIIKGIYIAQVRKGHKCAILTYVCMWVCLHVSKIACQNASRLCVRIICGHGSVAALVRVAGVTAGLAESNGSLSSGL